MFPLLGLTRVLPRPNLHASQEAESRVSVGHGRRRIRGCRYGSPKVRFYNLVSRIVPDYFFDFDSELIARVHLTGTKVSNQLTATSGVLGNRNRKITDVLFLVKQLPKCLQFVQGTYGVL